MGLGGLQTLWILSGNPDLRPLLDPGHVRMRGMGVCLRQLGAYSHVGLKRNPPLNPNSRVKGAYQMP